MKRMQLAATPYYPSTSSLTTFESDDSEPALASDGQVEHSLFVPLHYEKKYAYPLLVWLHSAGDNQRQLKRVMPQISLRNYLAIAPQGTAPDDDPRAFCWPQTEADVIDAQWRLNHCIETVQSRYNINVSRVFVGGFADGGTMALRLALRMPQLCAGAFSIGGRMPQSHAPLVNVENARGLPIMLMHGNRSRDYSPGMVAQDLRVLHAAGMSVSIRQYPAEDELTTQMLADVDAWMMERVTGIPCQQDQPACDLRERN